MISLRYADRLQQGRGLTWTDGERVEGYSNLLWVLMTAGLGWLGLDLVLATRLLGVAGQLALLFAVCLDNGGGGRRTNSPRSVNAGIRVYG